MSDQNEKIYPGTWRIASDFDPNAHMMNLKGKDYLNVQNRLLWFIRDQRDFIARGLATCSYCVRTELVEQDLERGFAHFKIYVRDVLGNEATMYGSETKQDFGDYAEKASTKSLGRALWALGYGTGMAPEMDEGEERPVDSPVERQPQNAQSTQSTWQKRPPVLAAPTSPKQPAANVEQHEDEPATAEQQERMRKAREVLGITDKSIIATDNRLRFAEAEARIATYLAQHARNHQLQGPAQANGKASVAR